MELNAFNGPWVDLCIKNARRIKQSGALSQVMAEVRGQRAHILNPIPIPLLVERAGYEAMVAGCTAIQDIQLKLMARMLAEEPKEAICAYFDIPPAIRPFIDWDELVAQRYLIARHDLMPAPDGTGLICELNVGSLVGGMGSIRVMEPYLHALDLPLGHGIRLPFPLMAEAMRRLTRDRGLRKIVLLTMTEYEYAGLITMGYYIDALAAAMPDIEIVAANEETCPAELLTPGGARDVAVFRHFTVEAVLENLPFFKKVWASGASVFTGFESEILSSKKWLSLFFDDRYRRHLDKDELGVIDAMIPPSRDLTPQNAPSFLAQKDSLIFKHNLSKGGADIVIGKDHSAEDIAVRLAHKEGWCVQDFVRQNGLELPIPGRKGKAAHDAVFGLYLFRDGAAGLYLRASHESQIVNVTSGAYDGWAYPLSLEDRDRLLSQAFGAEEDIPRSEPAL